MRNACVVAGVILLLGNVSTTPVVACADCDVQTDDDGNVSFICFDNAQMPVGYRYCATLDWKRLCVLWGSCPYPARDPVAALTITLTAYEVDGGSTSSFPSLVEAADVGATKASIASMAGVAISAVHLRGRAFITGLDDLQPSPSQAMETAGSGVVAGVQILPDGSVDLKVCTYPVGGNVSVQVEDTVSASEIMLVALPSSGVDVVLGVRASSATIPEWSENVVDWQHAFEEDVLGHLEMPLLGLSFATAPGECGS